MWKKKKLSSIRKSSFLDILALIFLFWYVYGSWENFSVDLISITIEIAKENNVFFFFFFFFGFTDTSWWLLMRLFWILKSGMTHKSCQFWFKEWYLCVAGTRFQATGQEDEEEDVAGEYEDQADCFGYHHRSDSYHNLVHLPWL